jgi:hypothetical protein
MSLYVPRKVLKAAKPGSSKNRAKVEHTQRMFALGFLSQLEVTTRRWADKVNKKETK